MRLGIDLDGCVANWVDGMRRHLVARGRPAHTLPEPTIYAFWPEWGLTKDEFFAHWDDWMTGGGFVNLDPYPGAFEALGLLNAEGHTLHIVTARRRDRRGIGQTIDWLERHGVPFKSLAFDSDKHYHPMDLWVEDHTENALAISRAGGRPIILDQGWNQECPAYIPRAYGWEEVVAYVEAATLGATRLWEAAHAKAYGRPA